MSSSETLRIRLSQYLGQAENASVSISRLDFSRSLNSPVPFLGAHINLVTAMLDVLICISCWGLPVSFSVLTK